jgi:excisionase family DNA binding protein
MAEGYRSPEGFVTMSEARQQLGVSKVTIVNIVKKAGIATFRDPRNGRVRLLRESDVQRLTEPVLESDEGNAQAA